ncbi:endonuclease domain-containing protein [Pantoea sp. A4]|uniref:endonuclease domain-containing protein n=1 Tax=Pantoea sp. A4 TaxID=1225184 RepID=UPI0005609839|nr:endonuclease domain-containing protein [Pantoea sp. A4]
MRIHKSECKALRASMTRAENVLWYHLRNRHLAEKKFRRQHAIGPFIVDFACIAHRLIIELDGGQHNEEANKRYDKARSDYLQRCGWTVLRFWNHEVFTCLDVVLQEIWRALDSHDTSLPSPQPSPAGGRGSQSAD